MSTKKTPPTRPPSLQLVRKPATPEAKVAQQRENATRAAQLLKEADEHLRAASGLYQTARALSTAHDLPGVELTELEAQALGGAWPGAIVLEHSEWWRRAGLRRAFGEDVARFKRALQKFLRETKGGTS
jgi:hypothetical protein